MNHNEITSMAREAGLFVPRAGLPENGALIRFFHAAYAAGAADALAEPVQEPAPMSPFPPVSQWKRGCAVCGLGADGKAYGYACPRSDCPTRVTCGGVV